MTREQAINRIITLQGDKGLAKNEDAAEMTVDALVALGLLQLDSEIQRLSPAARALVCNLGYSATQAQRLITTLDAAGFALMEKT